MKIYFGNYTITFALFAQNSSAVITPLTTRSLYSWYNSGLSFSILKWINKSKSLCYQLHLCKVELIKYLNHWGSLIIVVLISLLIKNTCPQRTAFKSSLVLKCLYLCHITIRTSLKVKDNVGSGGLKGRGMGSPCHPLLGGPKINISAELSFFKSKLTLTVRKVLKNIIRQLSRCNRHQLWPKSLQCNYSTFL